MSWWNTSNFSDLASKALKNAQSKIDKALDIQDAPGQTAAPAAGAASSTPPKSDFFGTLLGSDAESSSESGAASKSAWSFPWGAGAEKEGEANVEPVREKTAEEIKEEVLKAAKERTKAKSKLFPKKKQAGESPEPESPRKPSAEKDIDITDSSFDKRSVADTEKETVELRLGSAASKEEERVAVGEIKTLDVSKPEVAEIQIEAPDEKIISKLEVTDTTTVELTRENLSLSDSQADLQGSCFQEITEDEVISEHQTTDNIVTQEDKSEFLEQDSRLADTPREEDKHDSEPCQTSVVEESVIEETCHTIEQPETSSELEVTIQQLETPSEPEVTIEQPDTLIEPEIKVLVQDLEEQPGEVLHDKEINEIERLEAELELDLSTSTDSRSVPSGTDLEPVLADISSSVEFVTEKDLSSEHGEDSGRVVSKDSDSGDQSSSDPELVDYDRTSSDGGMGGDEPGFNSAVIQPDTLLLKVYSPEDEENDSNSKPDPVAEDLEKISTDANDHHIHESLSAGSLQSRLVNTESIERNSSCSDMDSSANRLDASMETSTSEDTIVDQTSTPYDSDSKLSSSAQPMLVTDMCEEEKKGENETSELGMDMDKGEERVSETLEDDCDDNDEGMDQEEDDEDKAELSPANSFVKCMLEDAIDDGKQDDNSDSHSTEKSDGSRSVYSNQESSDEIDTTTSSDIEIISMPTPNGENRQASPLDPVPLRIALSKTNWRVSPTHRRTDSSDSSNASKDGGMGELSPGRDQIEYTEYSKTHQEPLAAEGHRHQHAHDLPALSEEDDNPYHPQRLLKEDLNLESHDSGSHDPQSHDPVSHDPISHDVRTDFEQKMSEMAEVIQAREDKLLHMSKQNFDLMEANSILTNQLKQSEEAREAEMTDVNELTTEFTQRLTDAEKRVTAAIREKDHYKSQLQEVQTELAKRAGDVSLQHVLAEKEEQIQELLHEGEKLSKSQLQSNTIIKKLRQKEKDNDSTITTQKKKLESQKEELDHLHKVLESKEDLEKKQTEAIAQLNAAVNKQEQEMVRLKSEHEDAVEKARGLQVALDNSYKEMAELHRNSAALDSKAHEAALSAETQVREELKLAIEKLQQQTRWEKESLNMQIEDMRLGLARQEKDHNRREDLLKQEISDLHKQLQEDEARTQELTQGVSLATRPLLRQIENLQSTYNAQSSTWERVEKNISDRLADTQNQLAMVTEKERTANEQLLEQGSKLVSLETQATRLRQEKTQMSAQLEGLRSTVEASEDAKHNEAAQIEVMKQQMEKHMSDLKREKILLETQLDVEKSRVEQEKKKVLIIQDQLRDMEVEMARSKSRGTPVQIVGGSPSPRSVSRQDSMMGSMHEQSFMAITQDELDRSFTLASANGNKQSLYDALRQSGAANLLENLQSQLKLREGETIHLQGEIRSLERTRESMAKELVDLSNRNDDLEEKVKDVPILTEKFQDLDQRYNAMLQMYGEKVEECNELRLDLQDVKEMYKSQINQLIGQG